MRNFLYLCLFATLAVRVHAWSAAGHEIVANIAQIHLQPGVLPTICSLLYPEEEYQPQNCSLAYISTWADKFKYRMRWSAPLHYVNSAGSHPPDTCTFPGEKGWTGKKDINILGGIRNTTDILNEWVANGKPRGDPRAQEAVKFLVHFLGDLHQPMHMAGRDLGGNKQEVRWDGRLTNLHSVWDNYMVAKAIRLTPYNYTQPLPSRDVEKHLSGAIYDPLIRRIVWQGVMNLWADELDDWLDCPTVEVRRSTSFWEQAMQLVFRTQADPTAYDDEVACPYHWAQPIQKMNCDFIWPKELDQPPYNNDTLDFTTPRGPRKLRMELDVSSYAGKIMEEWILEKLLATGGIRLASILNAILYE